MAFKLFHAFVNPVADQAGFTGTKPSDWNGALEYSNTGLNAPSGTDAQILELLTADRSYYVRTDGSDSNTGLANTAGGAFLTLQRAYDVLAASVNLGGQTVTVNVADGTYTAGVDGKRLTGQAGIFNMLYTGNTSTPGNVIINTSGRAFHASSPGVGFYFSGFKITSTGDYAILAEAGAEIDTGIIELGACSGIHIGALGGGAIIYAQNDYTISGGAVNHFSADTQGEVVTFNGITVTLTGTPTFTTFANATLGGIIDWPSASGNTFSGAAGAGGKRYNADLTAVIQSGGGGANFFPGGVAGTTATGGQYGS